MSGFVLLLRAESVKLLSRRSARLGLVVAGALGLLGPLLLTGLSGSGIVFNGADLSQTLAASPPMAARWSLWVRDFWLMQAFVLLLASQSFAGELQARTLREDLVRPVGRSAVLAAKLGAVGLWIVMSLALQYLLSVGLGTVLFGTDGPWRDVTLGYVGSGLADLLFAAVVFAVAAVVRSVVGTAVGLLLFIVFSKLAGWALFLAEGAANALPPDMNQLPAAAYWLFSAQPMLPSAAWGIGHELALGADVLLVTWAAWAAYLIGGWAVADRAFAWRDIP
jgi:ABC-type transport system involved in multi-copper enzyme maturation permease subunit